MMARLPQDVTDAELAVLQLLWGQGPANRRQLADQLYPGGGLAHYTTVQKLLERLQAKGFVQADRGQALVTFRAAVSRDQLISKRLQDMADKLCDGSLTPLLTSLVRARQMCGRELDELRRLIEDLRGENRSRGKRR
jgi:BlaI family transcriptional regulator, penicillinase repressor